LPEINKVAVYVRNKTILFFFQIMIHTYMIVPKA